MNWKKAAIKAIRIYRFLGAQDIELGNFGVMDMANLNVYKISTLSSCVKVGHEYVKPWFIWSSSLGSRLASGFIDLSCFDGKGKATKGKQEHQNSIEGHWTGYDIILSYTNMRLG